MFLVLAMLAKLIASSWMSLIWEVCLLLRVNQHPKNLKGWKSGIDWRLELRNEKFDGVWFVINIDFVGLTWMSAMV